MAVLEHLHQQAQFDAVRMRLDRRHRRRQDAHRPRIGLPGALFLRRPARRFVFPEQSDPEMQPQVRIGHRALLEIFVHRQPAAHVLGGHLDRHLRAV